jgi:nucleotide-binding universal stress UspA family protein
VHVCEDPRAPVVLGTDEERILGPVRATLDAEAERLAALSGGVVQAHLAAGAAVTALVSVAELELAAALVLGGGPPARNLLGDTAERAARRSAVPVLALREPRRLRDWLEGRRTLRVLVGADAGRAAEAARAFAAGLAPLGPCEVEVAHVASPPEVHGRLGLTPPPDEHALAPEAEAALLRDLARSAPPGEVATLRVLPARGGADAHLVGRADQGGFDLVVVGQRRNSLVEQLWYGSVARGILRAAPVSVACVPPPPEASPPAFRPPRVVVVATDLTEAGDHALAQAVGLTAAGGTVHLVHVLPPAPSDAAGRAAREQAWYALSRAHAGGAAPDRPSSIERHVLEGAPADQVLALSRRVGADLIVLATRSRTAVGRALLGSVAQSVGQRAEVPVLLVPLAAT